MSTGTATDQGKHIASSADGADDAIGSSGGGGEVAAAPKIAPTLSTLPMGPLVSAVLYLTEGDVAQLLRTGKAMSTSPLFSDEFWRERCCSTFGRHLECLEVGRWGGWGWHCNI